MPDLVQVDLFAGGAVVARNVAREAALPRPRRKRLADTTHDAGRARPESKKSRDRAACLHAVQAAGERGMTRQELADALGIPIQTICWAVDGLLKEAVIAEPVVGYRDGGRPIHAKRDGKKLLVGTAFEPHVRRSA